MMNGTVLEINCEAIRANLASYRSLLKPGVKTMAMVKANAYGLGLIEIAKLLQREQVGSLGVAYFDEALELRAEGISLPILVMNPELTDFRLYESNEIRAAIYSLPLLRRFVKSKSQAGIQLKLETGMNRLGFSKNDLPELCDLLLKNPGLKIEGIFTHFSSSDNPDEDEYTRIQAGKFDEMCKAVVDTLAYSPSRHAVNSVGTTRFPEFHYDIVRLGIGLSGIAPTGTISLKHVCSLKTRVSQVRNIKKGESISYLRSGIATDDMAIAILPIGYGDGYLRTFGNGLGQVAINDRLVPTVGNICMDMTIIDVTGSDVSEGQEAIIFGKSPTIEELATVANTIPYEILTNVSERVSRIYLNQ